MISSAGLTATATGLIPFHGYHFAATAISDDGFESDFSAELVYVPAPKLVKLHFPEPASGIQSSPDLVNWTDRPEATQTNGDWIVSY